MKTTIKDYGHACNTHHQTIQGKTSQEKVDARLHSSWSKKQTPNVKHERQESECVMQTPLLILLSKPRTMKRTKAKDRTIQECMENKRYEKGNVCQVQ
jgi:hypothetical protein